MSQYPCSVIGCKPSDRRGRIRHSLPRDEAQRLAWLQCIGLPATQKYALVCDRHFKPEDYNHDPRIRHGMSTVLRLALLPGTLPTLFVPNRPCVPDPRSNVPEASQTCKTCRCRQAPQLSTASTQTTLDDCSRPKTSDNGTQTLTILRTAATPTPQQATQLMRLTRYCLPQAAVPGSRPQHQHLQATAMGSLLHSLTVNLYHQQQTKLVANVAADELDLAGDGHCDSPGRSAKNLKDESHPASSTGASPRDGCCA
ncbi:uncharacterized protein LOC119390044 [Rhipicephalus sanguineus]|uniref:uncharacterized protein LOC119390044 n=1 Tax=Rhipicephalus sanguineus TaxID=34632 RepID=UPI0018959947|nr:uncharacterized protein LOC119390044 [Rhipicephalus sanguineus]